MKRLAIILLLFAQVVSACAPTVTLLEPSKPVFTQDSGESPALPSNRNKSKTVVVFADDSLGKALEIIGQAIQEANPGMVVDFQYGDSRSLRARIEKGALADVFLSADPAEMDLLVAGKYVDAQAVNTFLANQLVVVLPALNTANLSTLQDLSKPGVRLVLADKELTLGKYTQQVLDNLEKSMGAGTRESVLKNVVSYEQDANQVFRKVLLDQVDAGVIYLSDLKTAPQLKSITIPTENNVPVAYSMAILSKAMNPGPAQIFMDYMISPKGEAVFTQLKFAQIR